MQNVDLQTLIHVFVYKKHVYTRHETGVKEQVIFNAAYMGGGIFGGVSNFLTCDIG